jgi:protein tyrosine phosphatase (PTP) superfamily phosphohydrolase (DUF442 family)
MSDMDLSAISAIGIDGKEALALTECPGRSQPYAASLARIIAWEPTLVISLVEEHEFPSGTAAFGASLAENGIRWRHFPIRDYDVPGSAAPWAAVSRAARSIIDDGGRVLVHCRAGLGRSGMIAARLLVERGMAPEHAIAKVRAARPGAIETQAQERWIGCDSVKPDLTVSRS